VNAVRGQRHAPTSPAAGARVWNQRAFVATGAILSGLSLPLTGLLDHAVGGTSAANAVGWSIAHVSLSCVFVGFCTWHIFLNRCALLRYLRGANARAGSSRSLPTWETVAAVAVVGGVLVLTVLHGLADG
jgi:hypothetical protein